MTFLPVFVWSNPCFYGFYSEVIPVQYSSCRLDQAYAEVWGLLVVCQALQLYLSRPHNDCFPAGASYVVTVSGFNLEGAAVIFT